MNSEMTRITARLVSGLERIAANGSAIVGGLRQAGCHSLANQVASDIELIGSMVSDEGAAADDDDVLMDVAEQLRRQLRGWQDETVWLTLADVREMLEAAMVAAGAGVVHTVTLKEYPLSRSRR